MPYYTFKTKMGFSKKEADKYGRFIMPLNAEPLRKAIKSELYQQYEGMLEGGGFNTHLLFNVLYHLWKEGFFKPNKLGMEELSYYDKNK